MCVFCGEFPGCNGEPWCEFCLQTLKIGSGTLSRTGSHRLMRPVESRTSVPQYFWCPREESNLFYLGVIQAVCR